MQWNAEDHLGVLWKCRILQKVGNLQEMIRILDMYHLPNLDQEHITETDPSTQPH